ncbi:MAG TPA: hypothetical protein VL463_13445 [Kofleriaceae bacterium]|nr:hypothetical protein [Kofleriaceae bacterium]
MACVGTVGGTTQNGNPDAPPVSNPDAPPAATINVTGSTMDYFGAVALPAVAYETDGMTPAKTGTSGSDGAFAIADVPPASSFYVSLSAGANYRPTRNDYISVTDTSVMANLYAVSKVDTQRQYATLGLTMTPGTSMLVADLRKNNGTPLEGVPLADISLVDDKGAPVPGIKGPYFFGPNGDVVSNAVLAVSTAQNGKARMAYLDVPPGAWVLNVKYLGGANNDQPMTMVVPSMSSADGVTLVSTGHQGGTGGGTGTTLTFTKDVYPLLQRAALGGQGCANCHNGTALAGGLAYDGPAADVYTKVMGTAGVVDLTTPAKSMLLSMPLYEVPPDLHPNATWLTMQDPAYLTIMSWIMQGAKQ